jgi:cytochrome c5
MTKRRGNISYGVIAFLGLTLGPSKALSFDINFNCADGTIAPERFGPLSCDHVWPADPFWPASALEDLPKVWGPPANSYKFGSDDYKKEFYRRYGLSFDPARQDSPLPIGVMVTSTPYSTNRLLPDLGKKSPGINVTCEACHTTNLFGKPVVGIGNPFFNMEALYNDLTKVSPNPRESFLDEGGAPFNPAGNNTVVNNGNQVTLFAASFHNPDFSTNLLNAIKVQLLGPSQQVKKDMSRMSYLKTPSWINFKTKQQSGGQHVFYADGDGEKDANYAAALYQLAFSNTDRLRKALSDWSTCAPTYLSNLSPPQYEFPIDAKKAREGYKVFQNTCARCHGTYDWPSNQARPALKSYPGVVVDVDVVKTDPRRAEIPTDILTHYNTLLVGGKNIVQTHGYVAPPLTSIWARGPYLHNGSVPTIASILFPDTNPRPQGYILPSGTLDKNNYDQQNLGWKTTPLSSARSVGQSPYERVYDPSKVKGLTNTGHPFGLSIQNKQDRLDLLEFLKTL